VVGDVFKSSGMLFASNLHLEIGKTIGQSTRSEQFWIFYNCGSSFASPSGKTHFRKNAPKTKNGNLKKL